MSRFAAPALCLEGYNVTKRQRGPSAKQLDLFCGKQHEGQHHSYHSLIGKTTQLNHNLYAEKRFSTNRGGQQCLLFLLIQNVLILCWTQVYKYVQNLGRVAREVGVEVRCGARAEHLRMEVGSRKPSKMSTEFDINFDKDLTDPGINYFCWYVRDSLACLWLPL